MGGVDLLVLFVNFNFIHLILNAIILNLEWDSIKIIWEWSVLGGEVCVHVRKTCCVRIVNTLKTSTSHDFVVCLKYIRFCVVSSHITHGYVRVCRCFFFFSLALLLLCCYFVSFSLIRVFKRMCYLTKLKD